MKIQIGYTPDADDAYMLYALLNGKVDTGELEIVGVEANLPSLNDLASRGQYEVSMVSTATYALVQKRYALLPSGATFGLGCGPVIVSREAIEPADLGEKSIAIPGATTTAYAMLQLYRPTLRTRILPFDKLLPAVETGLMDCALVIHEEFVTYRQWGLHVVLDLGQWWDKTYDLPVPVTCCVARRNLPENVQRQLATVIGQSVRYANEHHGEAIAFAMQYAHSSDPAEVTRFVREYCNELSIDMGPKGRESLRTFFQQAAGRHILPEANPVDVISL